MQNPSGSSPSPAPSSTPPQALSSEAMDAAMQVPAAVRARLRSSFGPQVRDLGQHVGQSLTLRGWAWHRRGSGKVQFLNFRDGSGFVQAVAGVQDLPEASFATLQHLGQESAVEIRGRVQANPRAPGGVELVLEDLQVLSPTRDYPITPKEHGTDFLMDLRHLWLRSPRQQAILAIRHTIISAIRTYFDQLGFTLVDAPLFTPNECEGSSTLFATDYFGEQAYLSQSGQLYMEAACQAVGRAYCFGPTFRAENSNTRRHLTEFWMVEPEVAFLDLAGDMDLAEGLLQSIVGEVLHRHARELQLLERDPAPLFQVTQGPFPRISYDEAVEILRSSGSEFQWGDDFGGADETIISSRYDRPVIVHRYPRSIKPFYMKGDATDSRVCLNMDILAPEGYGEVIGGGQREEDLQVLETNLEAQGLDPATYSWYLDLRRYGSIPHAGFGLGIERTVAWICGLGHVRETIPFPRLPKRLRP